MSINIRQKGQSGEREVCDWLNGIAYRALKDEGLPYPTKPIFQRNQNQSAVGGSDITNPMLMCLEVKRQEQLDLNAWWKQCVTAAQQFGGRPIVVFRQNGKRKWRILIEANVAYQCGQAHSPMRCEISHEDFETFAYNWMRRMLQTGAWKPVEA